MSEKQKAKTKTAADNAAPTNKLNLPDWLVKLSTSSGVAPAQLLQEYEEKKVKLAEEGKPGNMVATLAKYAIMGAYKKAPVVKYKKKESKYRKATIMGFKIGDLGMVDRAARMREWAQVVVDNNGLDEARKQGLVTVHEGKTLVLDTRDKIFGRTNKKKGEPLDPKLKLRERTIILLAKEPNDNSFMYTRLQTSDNKLALAWGQLPFNTMITAPIRIGRKDNAGILAASSSDPKDMTIFRQVDEKVDFFKTFEECMGGDVTPISDVPKYHLATEKNWERFVLVKGIVSSINLENPTYRGIQCVLMDEDEGYEEDQQVKFYVPDHIRINFGLYSKVYVLGKTKASYVDSEDEFDAKGKPKKILAEVTIDTWGIILVPGATTEPGQDTGLLEEEEEEQIDGFVPL